MELFFSKMQALGNDFVVIDTFSDPLTLDAKTIQHLADRHFGIGCDQLLLLEPCDPIVADARYRIFNADGQEVTQCGNGARCAAFYLSQKKLSQDPKKVQLQTHAHILETHILSNDTIEVSLGLPNFVPAMIPLNCPQQDYYALEVDGTTIHCQILSIGNPHCVLRVEDCKQAALEHLAPKIAALPLFPEGVNVNFMQIIDEQTLVLRVFERGVGETLACGSGAAASVIAGICQQALQSQVTVQLTGGSQQVRWDGLGHDVYLIGPAKFVFEGTIQL